jgi:hypothetical protein
MNVIKEGSGLVLTIGLEEGELGGDGITSVTVFELSQGKICKVTETK